MPSQVAAAGTRPPIVTPGSATTAPAVLTATPSQGSAVPPDLVPSPYQPVPDALGPLDTDATTSGPRSNTPSAPATPSDPWERLRQQAGVNARPGWRPPAGSAPAPAPAATQPVAGANRAGGSLAGSLTGPRSRPTGTSAGNDVVPLGGLNASPTLDDAGSLETFASDNPPYAGSRAAGQQAASRSTAAPVSGIASAARGPVGPSTGLDAPLRGPRTASADREVLEKAFADRPPRTHKNQYGDDVVDE